MSLDIFKNLQITGPQDVLDCIKHDTKHDPDIDREWVDLVGHHDFTWGTTPDAYSVAAQQNHPGVWNIRYISKLGIHNGAIQKFSKDWPELTFSLSYWCLDDRLRGNSIFQDGECLKDEVYEDDECDALFDPTMETEVLDHTVVDQPQDPSDFRNSPEDEEFFAVFR